LDLRLAEPGDRIAGVDNHRQCIARNHDFIELGRLVGLKFARRHADLGHAVDRRTNARTGAKALVLIAVPACARW
jgi:hypothetical protein